MNLKNLQGICIKENIYLKVEKEKTDQFLLQEHIGIITAAAARVGIEDIGTHSMRKTFRIFSLSAI